MSDSYLSCWTKGRSAEGVKGGGFAPCILPLTPAATMENPAGQKTVDSLRRLARSPLQGALRPGGPMMLASLVGRPPGAFRLPAARQRACPCPAASDPLY